MSTLLDTTERRVTGMDTDVSEAGALPLPSDIMKKKGKGKRVKEAAVPQFPEPLQEIARIKKRDKVAIVGYAPSSRDKAPYDDQEWDIWGVNELYLLAKRVDVIFDMHKESVLRSKDRNPNHFKWLCDAKIPIVLLNPNKKIKTGIRFPLEFVLNFFRDYFTNSVSYMIAIAVLLGYKEIGLWGVDMATEEEYQHQRPSVEYFVGKAEAILELRGGRLVIPPESDICKALYHYGYDDELIMNHQLKNKARKNELQTRINGYRAQAEQAMMAMNQMMGALDDCNYWERTWVNPQKIGNEIMKNDNVKGSDK